MKQLKSQRGAIDIVLIAVLAVAIAAFGGYVYCRQQQANKTYNAAGSGVTVSKHVAKKTAPVEPAQTPAPPLPGPKVAVTSSNNDAIIGASKAYCDEMNPGKYGIATNGEKTNQPVIIEKLDGNYADASVSCGFGSQFTLVKASNGWEVVFWGQEAPGCTTVKFLIQYKIPSDILQCYDASTNAVDIR